MTSMTQAQALRAWHLARAHGHGWATDAALRDIRAADEYTVEQAAAAAMEACPSWPGLSPEMSGEAVIHTTGTGRVSWVIERDGTAHVTVSRPDPIGPVMWVSLGPQATGRETVYVAGPIHVGHIPALNDALRALAAGACDAATPAPVVGKGE